jgi:cytochrome b561
MASLGELSFLPPASACSRKTALTALYGCIALVTVAIGLWSLLGATWQKQYFGSWFAIHVLFGLLLCGVVVARCQWCIARATRALLPADVRSLSRHLSRIVYLMLYLSMGAREMVAILSSLWHRSAVDFSFLGPHAPHGPDYLGFYPNDDLQMFVASGLCALIFVRILAFRLRLRSTARVAAS